VNERPATGAELLWPTKANHVLPVEYRLGDGSFLSRIYPTQKDRRHQTGGVRVRVVEYLLDPPPSASGEETRYRLLTTILEDERAPAAELAGLYPERWEFETALDELKTHHEARAWYFAPRCLRACSRRHTDTCACTTPSAGSCTRSLTMPARTPTG